MNSKVSHWKIANLFATSEFDETQKCAVVDFGKREQRARGVSEILLLITYFYINTSIY